MPPRSLLVISAAPDDRPSTEMLLLLVKELRRRSDVRTCLWFLRRGEGDASVADRVVDDLRTGRVAKLADAVGLGAAGRFLSGRRLRRWWKDASPDAVLLDDGLGERVVLDDTVATVVRVSDSLPSDAALEGAPRSTADVWMVNEPVELPAGQVIEVPRRLWELHHEVDHSDPAVRLTVRRRLGLPEAGPLVVGWGAEVWADGVDVFIRSLWTLEHREGVVAHGLWIGLEATAEELALLDGEAQRCGLAGRLSYVTEDSRDARLCGDAVLLPYRSEYPSDRPPLREVLVSGAQVVASDASTLDGSGITVVANVDANAAGAALARCLADDRGEVSAALARRYHVGPWADDLIDALGRVG